MKQAFSIAWDISVAKTRAISNEGVITKKLDMEKHQKNRISVAALVVLLSAVVSACETSQLLDLSDPGPTAPVGATTAPDSKSPVNGENPAQNRRPTKISNSDSYPSLNNQPAEPRKTLSTEEKDREIREMQDSSQSIVQQREADLESRKTKSARKNKPASRGVFGLGWLVGEGSTVRGSNTGGLTPPEKLRLSRLKAANRDLDNSPDTVASTTPNLSPVRTGLRTKPIIPSVPEKKQPAPRVSALKKTTPRDGKTPSLADVANRPTAQQPLMIKFSNGARKLSKKQKKPLDKIAKFRNNDGMNIYVLGFAQVVPEGNKEANIESQDLAISRANEVANGLRKRGFAADQVVVQIIDEIQETGKKGNATLRRVDVYFENSQLAEQTEITEPKQEKEKSSFGFFKTTPFEPAESEN